MLFRSPLSKIWQSLANVAACSPGVIPTRKRCVLDSLLSRREKRTEANGSTLSFRNGRGSSPVIGTGNKIPDGIAPRWNETRKQTVLFAFGGERPRHKTLSAALA
jgi:hypothetical protein